jgi:hypothetical protein
LFVILESPLFLVECVLELFIFGVESSLPDVSYMSPAESELGGLEEDINEKMSPSPTSISSSIVPAISSLRV